MWYHPKIGSGRASKKRVDTDLGPGELLSLGFGNSGSLPWSFSLEPEQEVAVSLFKIFLSTKAVDMSTLQQESPFNVQRKPARDNGEVLAPPSGAWWATRVLTVVQRAKGNGNSDF